MHMCFNFTNLVLSEYAVYIDQTSSESEYGTKFYVPWMTRVSLMFTRIGEILCKDANYQNFLRRVVKILLRKSKDIYSPLFIFDASSGRGKSQLAWILKVMVFHHEHEDQFKRYSDDTGMPLFSQDTMADFC
jgi:hypothetical protein